MADQSSRSKHPSRARRMRRALTLLLLFSIVFGALTGCKAGYHPVDDMRKAVNEAIETAQTTAQPAEEDAEKAAEPAEEPEKEDVEEEETADEEPAEEPAEEPEEPAEEPEEPAEDAETEDKEEPEEEEKAEPAEEEEAEEPEPTEPPEPAGPDTAAIRKALEEEGFTFYINNLVKDPEPDEIIYADRPADGAELTVLYGVFESAEQADLAIRNLLESDMVDKALSFGAKLDQAVDEVETKLYYVSLKSLFANARAEMRQQGNRIGVVFLFKKNDKVEFEPYFELMELPEP